MKTWHTILIGAVVGPLVGVLLVRCVWSSSPDWPTFLYPVCGSLTFLPTFSCLERILLVLLPSSRRWFYIAQPSVRSLHPHADLPGGSFQHDVYHAA